MADDSLKNVKKSLFNKPNSEMTAEEKIQRRSVESSMLKAFKPMQDSVNSEARLIKMKQGLPSWLRKVVTAMNKMPSSKALGLIKSGSFVDLANETSARRKIQATTLVMRGGKPD